MKLNILIKGFWWIFLINFFSACNDVDLADMDKTVNLGEKWMFPVGKSDFTIAEIFDKMQFSVNMEEKGQEVCFVFRDTATISYYGFDSQGGGAPSRTTHYPSPGSTSSLPPGHSLPVQMTGSLDLGVSTVNGNDRINRLDIAKIVLQISVKTTGLGAAVRNMVIALDNCYESDGVTPLEKKTVSLTGGQAEITFYNIVMTIPNGKNDPEYTVTCELYNAGNGPLTITPAGYVEVEVNPVQVDCFAVYGAFVPISSSRINKKVKINIPELTGDVKFRDPRAYFTINSNLGIPFSIDIDYVWAYPANGTPIVQTSISGERMVMDEVPEKPDQWVSKTFPVFDKDNGNLDVIFDKINPYYLEYNFSLNRANNYVPQQGFITSGTNMKIETLVELPLDFKAGSSIQVKDTLTDISFSTDEISLNNAKLVLYIRNGLPANMVMDLEFLDQSYNQIPTDIQKQYDIESPEVNDEGRATGIAEKTIEVDLTSEQIDDLEKTHEIALSFLVKGQSENKRIHFVSDDLFEIKLGIMIDGVITKTF